MTQLKTMNVCGREYAIIDYVDHPTKEGVKVPLLDIPMMSDERWNELTLKNARNNFRKHFGYEAPTDEEAYAHNRKLSNNALLKSKEKTEECI